MIGLGPREPSVLVHLASGVGNIILATPLLLTLIRHGFNVDLLIDGDYRETADLFRGWGALGTVHNSCTGERPTRSYDFRIPALPPFYWSRYAGEYRTARNAVMRPPDSLFYRDEQAYYLEFATALGCEVENPPYYFLPAVADAAHRVTCETLILAPGCKTGEMAAKRWSHFPRLAELFEDVVIVGTRDDLDNFDGTPMRFPTHVRCLVGQLSLRETADVMAAAGAVVANDSGLGHIAGAVGTPTILLFGPTPDATLGRLPPNVKVLRAGLACEPCWFGDRFGACAGRVACMPLIEPRMVAAAIAQIQNQVSAIAPA
jgi:ADP-heptose:LPS heptosyltransferase